MYIHSTFKQINPIKSLSEYKKQLKEMSTINLRRSSKFNILAVYGALKCLNSIPYDKNISIYIASEYGCTQDMLKVLAQVNTQDDIVMPFDFLNVNTNNVGFFISSALNTTGNNINITAEDFSFEKAFELAYFDLLFNESIEALIGGVDESLEECVKDNTLIHNLENKKTQDGTSWLFLSKEKNNAIAKIEKLETYPNIEELNSVLRGICYDKISLNQYAKKYQDSLDIQKEFIIEQKDEFYGTSSAGYIVNLLTYSKELIHISLDSKKRAYLFYFSKL